MVVNLDDLNAIFNKAFETEITINEDTVRDDFGAWDSINHLNLVVELEDFYGVQFSMDQIKEMISVRKILEILASK